MITSSADLFRIRQAVADLRAYARGSGPLVRARLASGLGGGLNAAATISSINRIVDEQGGRFALPNDSDIYEACLLAAALPHDDYPAFTFATSLLLLDRLQKGDGRDDLFWNWDSFAQDYALADRSVRSALMNGFRIGEESGLVSVAEPPKPADCLTRSQREVTDALSDEEKRELRQVLASSVSPSVAGQAWADAQERSLSSAEIALFRYLYERPNSMAPPSPSQIRLVPWSAD